MGTEIMKLLDAIIDGWNNHDAAGFAAPFSEDAVLRIVATGEVARGREQIQRSAEVLLIAFPDLRIERRSIYVCGEVVRVTEFTLTGTHKGEFMGIPATRHSVELPACSIFTQGADQLISEEIVYFDAATLLRQLGVLSEPVDA